MDAGALAARVRAAFPELAFEAAVLDEKGEDHHVLVLDGRFVFRFPRHANHPTGLALEMAVLRALRGRCALPMPDYRYVSPAGDFAGYELIEGVELTPGRFAGLSRVVQERVLEQLAGFLSAIHALAPDDIVADMGAAGDVWPRLRTPAEEAEDGRSRRLPPIAGAYPALTPLVEDFYARFEQREAGAPRVLHSDVTSDHLLLAPSADRLAGVIDFGDVELGDPTYDFAYLWSYGDWAPLFVFERYALRDQDAGLLERSRWEFARYRISRLGEAIENRWTQAAEDGAAQLPAILAAL
jgi:aminoglycoside phosphotransferase (APT) family kinase protein